MLQPFPDPARQLLDGLGLIALRAEIGNDFEIRHALHFIRQGPELDQVFHLFKLGVFVD